MISILTALWGFLKTPFGRLCTEGVLLSIVLLSMWVWGYSRGHVACEATHNKADQLEITRQAYAATAAINRAAASATEAAAAAATNAERAKHVIESAKASPDAAAVCVPAGIADGLRAIH